MASLEGWGAGGHGEDGRASAASMRSIPSLEIIPCLPDGSIATTTSSTSSSSGAIAPPPTPRERNYVGRRAGFGGTFAFASAPAMSLVAPGLYVGDEAAAANLAGLRQAGVTHVLNCSALANPHEGQPNAPTYMQLGLLDNTSDLPRMQEALGQGVEFIAQAHAAGGTVLVHCHRGISRSATLSIAYLVRSTQQPAETVFEHLRTKRKCIDPNLGYWVALKTWERRVLPPAMLRARSSFSSPTPVRPLSRAG